MLMLLFLLKLTRSIRSVVLSKKQNDKYWWFEFNIPEKYSHIVNSLLLEKGIIEENTSFRNTASDSDCGIYLGSEKDLVFQVISLYFQKVYKCKMESKMLVVLKKTRLEASIVNEILEPTNFTILNKM